MKEKKENSLQEMIDTEISVNETQSKFYKIFYDNIYTYVIMNTYLKLLLKHQLNLNTIIQAKIDKIIEQKLRENYSIFFRKSIHEQLGLKHSLTENEINSLIEFKLLRDLYAHGDGTVTQIYLDKVPNSKVNLGDKLNLTLELIIESYTTVIKILNKNAGNFRSNR